MAVNNADKKKQYIVAVVANQKAFQAARLEATKLREAMSSDAVIDSIVDADCEAAGGSVAHTTAAILDNYLAVTLDIEKALTNQVVATSNRLPSFLAVGG